MEMRTEFGLQPQLACALIILVSVTFLFVACDGGGSSSPAGSAVHGVSDAGPKNVLLITVDTLRADRLSCYGAPITATPHLDSLASHGTLFTCAVTPANTTLPAHASLFTSLWPDQHGGLKNGQTVRTGLRTLAGSFREAGYRTAAMVNSWVLGPDFGLDAGFQRYEQMYKRQKREKGTSGARRTIDAALSFVKENSEIPFFLWLHFMDPHQAYDPPSPYRPAAYDGEIRRDPLSVPTVQDYLRIWEERRPLPPEQVHAISALYDGEVAYVDFIVGRLLVQLSATGQLTSTLIVMTADHGEALHQPAGYFGHARSLVESVTTVPLILSGPEIPKAKISDESCTLLDLAPTLLARCGLSIPPAFEGRNLTHLFQSENSPLARATSASTQLVTRAESGLASMRNGRHKARFDRRGRVTALFDLESDPGEQYNLAASNTEMVKYFGRQLQTHRSRLEQQELPGTATVVPESDPTLRQRLEALGYLDTEADTTSDASPEHMK